VVNRAGYCGVVNEMALPLQTALFLASVAVVILVGMCIPAILQLRKHADRMAQSMTELKAEVSLLVQDSRATLQDVERVLQTVRGWTERVDRVVDEVGTAVEPPILAAARNVQVVYKGIAKFFETFLNRNHHHNP
jgi:uncharacterized protein YoxC